MMYLHPVAMIPNDLINNTAVQYSTKRIAVVLLLLSGRKNRSLTIKFAELARIARCSTTTVQQAIRELVNGGYIIKSRNYRWDKRLGRHVYASNSYCWVYRTGGYTMVRREILDYDLTPAAFAELLYLYRCAGREGRAFPSLRQIAGRMKAACAAGLDMAKSTVCAAARALSVAQASIRKHCKKMDQSHAANNYYLTDLVVSHPSAASCVGGSPKSDKHIFINQITRGFNERKEKSGVAQFGSLTSFDEYEYDGTGVRVHVYAPYDELLA